ncbi:hypothetical protein SLA2020_278410 [Shorea laevis]
MFSSSPNTPSSSIFHPFSHRGTHIRCSIAKESFLSSPSSEAAGNIPTRWTAWSSSAGFSSLCISHALATKHFTFAPNLIVTEARDRVGSIE